eukprot:gene1900-biopygen9059
MEGIGPATEAAASPGGGRRMYPRLKMKGVGACRELAWAPAGEGAMEWRMKNEGVRRPMEAGGAGDSQRGSGMENEEWLPQPRRR